MALNRTHAIDIGIGGTYFVLKDTTGASNYEANGIDPLHVKSITYPNGITDGELSMTNADTKVVYTISLTGAQVIESMTSDGFRIDTALLDPSVAAIPDGLYTTVYTVSAGSGPTDYESELIKLFYGVSYKDITNSIISTSWKIVYTNRNPYYDNALKLKSWFTNMTLADELGFHSESLRLLKALQKTLV